jgi:hypothetical protein
MVAQTETLIEGVGTYRLTIFLTQVETATKSDAS